MLLGEYRRSVKGAGWLCLPSSIRHALCELYAPDDTALILTTFFERCLVCYPRVEWFKAPEKLRRMGTSPAHLRHFRTSAALCPLDEEGRLYIPHLFRQYAQIERDVLVIGIVCWLELWSPHQWEQYEAEEAGRW
jgi:MraZ protein